MNSPGVTTSHDLARLVTAEPAEPVPARQLCAHYLTAQMTDVDVGTLPLSNTPTCKDC